MKAVINNASKYSLKTYIQSLDQWDLDDALKNLKENKLSLQPHVTVAPLKTHQGKSLWNDSLRL